MTDSPQPPDSPQAAPEAVGKRTMGVLAFLMALPAAVPILVIFAPSLVPFVGPVDTSDSGMVAFLVGMALVLLLSNWGFLYIIYRWLNNMARDQT
jgi:uncharacterized BrkB/YihY/UPF0761 family membrane protein